MNRVERLERLRLHLKSRRGRRDFQALTRLVDIRDGLKHKSGSTLRSMDAMLREYYTLDLSKPYTALPSFFAMCKADPACPTDRAYAVAYDRTFGVITNAEEVDVVSKYRCEHCDELIEIAPLHKPTELNRRQRLVPHTDKKTGKPCLGSEKNV